MPFIIAQEVVPATWERILLGYGPLGVIVAVVLYFVVVYGRRLLDGHLSFMEHTKETNTKLASSIETLSGTQRDMKHEMTEQRKLQERMLEQFVCRAPQR